MSEVTDDASKKLLEPAVQMLPICDDQIKLLRASKMFEWYAFAIDANGKQVKISLIDEGVLGDNRYPDVRLF